MMSSRLLKVVQKVHRILQKWRDLKDNLMMWNTYRHKQDKDKNRCH